MTAKRSNYRYFVPVRTVITSKKGIKPKILRKKSFRGCVPYLDIHALETGVANQFTFKELGTACTEDDVLIVWDGSRCGLPLRGREGVLGSTIVGLTPIGILPEYLYYFLESKFDLINGNPTGTGIPHVDSNLFYDLNIPISPVDKQLQIVDQIKLKREQQANLLQNQKTAILNSIDVTEIDLNKDSDLNQIIDNIKKATFNLAFSGKLSSSWRKKNQIETSSWEEKEISEIADLVTSGSRDWSKYYSNTGARFIRTQDIRDNVINTDKMIFVKLPENAVKRTMVEKGNLLLTIIGSNIGKCALVDDKFGEEGYVSQAIALIKLKEYIYPDFVHLFMQSPMSQAQINIKTYGDAQPAINLIDVRKIKVPLPSLEEQKFVVLKVNKLITTISKIKSNFVEIIEKSAELEKSILQEAFDGNEIISKVETFENVLSNLKIEKEMIEMERRDLNKIMLLAKHQILNQMESKETLLELLVSNPSIRVEELWQQSLYFEKRDVEAFYEELSQLEQRHKIAAVFSDKDKSQSYINLL